MDPILSNHRIHVAFPLMVTFVCGVMLLLTPFFFIMGSNLGAVRSLDPEVISTLVLLAPVTAIVTAILTWLNWKEDRLAGFFLTLLLLPLYWGAFYALSA